MIVDLFAKPKSMEAQLEDFCRERKWVASHEIIRWGVDNFYIRADRTKRDLVKIGVLRKLSEQDKHLRGFYCKDAVYEYIGGQQ